MRILDTRDTANVGLPGPFVTTEAQKLQVTGSVPTTAGNQIVVPDGATGVLLNVTVVAPSAGGFLSVRPGSAGGVPATSSLNFAAGVNIPNAVQVALPTAGANAGQIDIVTGGPAGATADVLIDVVAYLEAGAAGPPGPAGSAVAYAQISDGGATPSLQPERTMNITAVARPSTGVYCLTVDPSVASLVFDSDGDPIRTMVATVEFGNTTGVTDAQVRVRGANATCGDNLLEIRTFDGAALSNAVSFTVAVI